jgi:PAS domain S-box-containing protein
MNSSAKKKNGLKTELEIKEQEKKSSLNKKSIENIPEIDKTFFDNSLDAMMIGSQDGRIYKANHASCRMLGYSEEEICKLGRKGIVEATPQLFEAVRKQKETSIFFGELTYIRKDGTKFPAEVSSSIFTVSDGSEFTSLIIRDISERKKTEKSPLENEDRYHRLLDNSGLGICLFSTDGNILMLNHVAIENLGGQLSDYAGKNLTEVFGKELGQMYIERSKVIAESEKPVQYEDNVQLGGRPGWYHSTLVRILNKNGEIEGILVISNNITSRKIAEDKLLASELEYRSLFENSIIGISQTFPDGRYKRINKAYAEMYGYPDTNTMIKEVSGNLEMLYSHPEDRKRVFEILDKTGYMPPTEIELNRRDGKKFWAIVGARQVKDSTGKLLYFQAEQRDITNRKTLEKEMFSNSRYARSLIEASLDPLVTISKDGKITDVNLATEKITGLKRAKLIGTDFADYFSNPQKARKGYKSVFKKGTVKNYPLSIMHTSGREIDVLYNATTYKNESGEVQGVFAAARDVTEQKKMEEELRKSRELLEKLNQHLVEAIENERKQIALNLHDDLGQKLTAFNLDIAWLKSRIGVQSKVVTEKIENMSLMIKEMFDTIRETSSLLRPAILFDLGLVAAINAQLINFERQTGIKCYFNCNTEEELTNDRISLILYRLFQESLTNITRHSQATETEVTLQILWNKVEMNINDNGIGISKDLVSSLKSMGIAGMKERVKLVNGKITIGSKKGLGTRITIIIPLNRREE